MLPHSPLAPDQYAAIVGRLRAAGCVFAEDEADLLIGAASTAAELDALVDRRAGGLPLEYVVGWAAFCGERVSVDPGVFVPRRRTEFLVSQVAARPGDVIVDLCCGSGAVGVALLAGVADLDLHAADIDPAAVRCARRNLDGRAHVYAGDLDAPLPTSLRGRVNVLIANGPYVPTDEIRLLPPEARDHEPHVSLDGGADGLDILRRVVRAAPGWLVPGGRVLVETSAAQAPLLIETVADAGLTARVATSEELNATVVIGSRPA